MEKNSGHALIGQFNAYNLLLVFGVASILGQDELEVLKALSTLGNVDGRFQTFRNRIRNYRNRRLCSYA